MGRCGSSVCLKVCQYSQEAFGAIARSLTGANVAIASSKNRFKPAGGLNPVFNRARAALA
ncbi:hypothetical protein EMIT048CA2_240052 [Pseudomonas chlororaphis]